MAKVSVIIPYNKDRGWLDKAIESVENQTYKDYELILSQSPNRVGYNINRGIEKAKGDYIKFFAEDDLLTPNCLEDSLKAIRGYDFIHGVAYNFSEKKPLKNRRVIPSIKYPTLEEMLEVNRLHGGTLFYRRDVFDRFGMFDQDLWTGEEYEFNLRILSLGAKIGYTKKHLFNYRLHPEQKSIGVHTLEYREKRRTEIERIKSFYRNKNIKKVIAIATFKGREEYLKKTIQSLLGQADEIRIYNNETRPIDLTDNGKFFFLHEYKEPVYYLTCDDDIIYPPTYAEDMIKAIDRTKGIVSHHGRILKKKGVSYYRGGHTAFRCTGDVRVEQLIDIGGSGVMGWRTDLFNPVDLYKSEYKRMSDIIVSLEAARQGVKITVLPHKKHYIVAQPVPNEDTIFGQESGRDAIQSSLADEVYSLVKG